MEHNYGEAFAPLQGSSNKSARAPTSFVDVSLNQALKKKERKKISKAVFTRGKLVRSRCVRRSDGFSQPRVQRHRALHTIKQHLRWWVLKLFTSSQTWRGRRGGVKMFTTQCFKIVHVLQSSHTWLIGIYPISKLVTSSFLGTWSNVGLLSEFPWEVCAGLPGCVGVVVTVHVHMCFSLATPPRSLPPRPSYRHSRVRSSCLHQWFLCKVHPLAGKNPPVMFYFHGSSGERIHSLFEP